MTAFGDHCDVASLSTVVANDHSNLAQLRNQATDRPVCELARCTWVYGDRHRRGREVNPLRGLGLSSGQCHQLQGELWICVWNGHFGGGQELNLARGRWECSPFKQYPRGKGVLQGSPLQPFECHSCLLHFGREHSLLPLASGSIEEAAEVKFGGEGL